MKTEKQDEQEHTASSSPTVLTVDVIASALRQPTRRKFPPVSFTQAPPVPLPLWQRVSLSAIGHLEQHTVDARHAKSQLVKLDRELQAYHASERERAEKLRAQQQDARARLGGKVMTATRRFWRRKGDAFQGILKVEFEALKHYHDKRKQEDLLRETEELTRKLLDSILDTPKSAEQSSEGGGAEAASAMPARLSSSAPGGIQVEHNLRLLDTQNGKRPLRDYQRSALSWMVHLYENKLNGILADEMGLGKTVQTIALLCYFAEKHNDWGPHLIVVPTTVVLNWKAELERWAPGLKVVTYIGNQKERQKLRKGWMTEDAFHVCVTSYNLVVRDRTMFRRRPWGFLVLDEAHQLKNFMSQKWQALFDLQAEYRLLLTGTPLQNSIMELWSLFHFLLPFASAFQSNEEFKEWFSNPLDEMVTGKSSLNEDIVRRLQALIRPFMLRRLKKDVESQLPTKTEKVVVCRLSRRQRGIYDDYMQLTETRNRLRSGGAGGVLSVLLALRKVCDHPDLFEERPTVSPFVMGYDDEIRIEVPRQVLLLGNTAPPRTRVRVEIFDLHDDLSETNGSSWADHRDRDDGDDAFKWLSSRWMELLVVDHVYAANHKLYLNLLRRFAPGHGQFTSRCLPEDLAGMHTVVLEERLNTKMSAYAPPQQPPGTSALSPALASLYRHAAARLLDERANSYSRFNTIQALRVRRLMCALRVYVPRTCVEVHKTFRDVWLKQYDNGSLCPTVRARVLTALPIIKKVASYVPAAVVSRSPTLVWRRPVSRMAEINFRIPTRDELANTVIGPVLHAMAQRSSAFCEEPDVHHSPLRRRVFDGTTFAEELWPIHARRFFSFPDKRLLIHDCGKLQFLETALKQLRQDGHRMLIFTQFTQMLNILERFLAIIGVRYMRLDGSTRVELRQELVDRFNADPRFTCMILSTRSGGIGLNLTGADTVIFYDSDWNPTMDLQAQDRCHRIGQTKPVTIYRLVSEHTVEESILAKARERKKLNNVVIRGGQFHAIADVVDESYTDSAEAYAALAEPVNLRSFFHDLDEDATVPLEPTGAGAAPTTLTEDDFIRELGLVEDDEDRSAQRTVEEELRQRADEDAADADDEDEAGSGTLRKGMPPHGGTIQLSRRPHNEEEMDLYSAHDYGDDEKDEDVRLFGTEADDKQVTLIRQAIRKRQRDSLFKGTTPVDRLLTARYAVCHEEDAHARYEKLCDGYEARLADSGQLPPFRKLFRL